MYPFLHRLHVHNLDVPVFGDGNEFKHYSFQRKFYTTMY